MIQRQSMRTWAFAMGALLPAYLSATDMLPLGFSVRPGSSLPQDWRVLEFKNKAPTTYALSEEAGITVVEASSSSAASGLIRPVDASAKDYPMLRWRWRVDNLIAKSDARRRKGDDYPARIYVTFVYDPERASVGQRIKYRAARLLYGEYPPHAALNYIWARAEPVGSLVPNAYTDRTWMIVVNSGEAGLGQWIDHARNIYEDYRQAFGEEPPPISGVAIMTDTDDTGEHARAAFAQISLGR